MQLLSIKQMINYINQPNKLFKPLLGIDFGSYKIGLSISNKNRMKAKPLSIEKMKNHWEKRIEYIIKKNECIALIIGAPYNIDGTDNIAVYRIKNYIKRLYDYSYINCPCCLFNEGFSTHEAHLYMNSNFYSKEKKINMEDSIAASIILQNFLNLNYYNL